MEPLEEYRSPFDFNQGVDARYLFLSPAYGDTPAVASAGNHKEERQSLECVWVCDGTTGLVHWMGRPWAQIQP